MSETKHIPANLRLAAAAPELLEACRSDADNCTRALEAGDQGDWKLAQIYINNQRGIAQAAIAKATT